MAEDAERRTAEGEVLTPVRAALGLWSGLLILQMAVIGGAMAAYEGMHGSWLALVGGQWQIVLITLATMSLGFGAATLLYGRLASRASDGLERDYRSLASRADFLLKSTSARGDPQEAESLRAR